MFVMASADAPSKQRKKREKVLRDSIEISDIADTILRDSLLSTNDTMLTLTVDTTLALGVDTTKMDSLQLAIYHHNKAIDDSIRLDSINRQRAGGINSPVNYSANDSLVYDAVTKTARLYGSSTVKYENLDLAAERIHMSIDSSLVHATGAKDKADTTGMTLFGTPVFSKGSDKYESDTMAFNFKTKKGLFSNVYTQQEDGFLRSEISKRSPNGDIFLQHGRYTTCDAEHPDFYIALSRAKVRPGKEVVFGPAYLVVADVPLPFAIPYGFFPFTKSYSSGFIMPTYGDESNRGFYLRDGGYYFAISDKMDLKLLGEIYTKGSWGLSAAMNYTKGYRFSGCSTPPPRHARPCKFPEHADGRQGNARLHPSEKLQDTVEPPPGSEGKPLQLALSQRQLRYVELRAQQPQLFVQSADSHAVDTYVVCVVEHNVLEYRFVAQLYSQPLAEHVRLVDCDDPARPQHLALALLPLQA